MGHSVNVYNDRTLALLARQGCKRWVLPVELTHETLAEMQRLRPDGVETEVLGYGRLPLAYSARCFTARARNLPKDDCRYACIDDPDGLVVSTQDDNRFLALNGIQTQSARTMNLLPELGRMRELGVDILRISPQANRTDKVIDLFHRALTGELDPMEASTSLERLMPTGPCDGYWHGGAGMDVQAQNRAGGLDQAAPTGSRSLWERLAAAIRTCKQRRRIAIANRSHSASLPAAGLNPTDSPPRYGDAAQTPRGRVLPVVG